MVSLHFRPLIHFLSFLQSSKSNRVKPTKYFEHFYNKNKNNYFHLLAATLHSYFRKLKRNLSCFTLLNIQRFSHYKMAVIADLSIGRVFCDFLVLLCLAIPLLIFHEWVTPYKRGFYCDDESIRYPYQKSTVSRQLLIVVGILIPTALIVLTELLRAMGWERHCADEFGTYRYRKYNVHRLIVRLYVFIGYFLLGICFNQLMVDIAKYTIGRHRPHFMDVCKPATRVPTRKSDGTTEFVLMDFRTNCPPDDHRYITEFECQGQNPFLIHESMLSFYSGHSAFSFYAAWYTSLYLQARIYRALVSELVLPAVQFSLFGGAAFVAYTRVSNYKHHWSDVLVGALIGSAIGIINALFIAEVFQRREVPIEYRRRRRLIDKFTAKGNEEGEEVDIEMGQVGQERGAGTRPITAGSAAGGGGMVEGQNNGGSGQQQTASAGQQQQQQVRYVPIRVISRNNESERL